MSVTLKYKIPKDCMLTVPLVVLYVHNDKNPGKNMSKIDLPPSLIEKKNYDITLKISLLQVVKAESFYKHVTIVTNVIQKKWFGKQTII